MTTSAFDDHPGIEPESDAFGSTLVELYAADVPPLAFTAPAATPVRVEHRQSRWRTLAGLGAAAAIAVAVLVGTQFRGGGTPTVSAEEILNRTKQAAATGAAVGEAQSYHLVAHFEGGKSGAASRLESWYNDPTHNRHQDQYSDVNDLEGFTSVMNGNRIWLEMRYSDGETRVATYAFAGVKDLGEDSPSSLAGVLDQWGAEGCRTVTQTGETTVAARTAYVLTVTPVPGEGCRDIKRMADPKQEGVTTVWVDRETFITLKTEVFGPAGEVQMRYVVDLLEIGPQPASMFTYQPPAGVTVFEAKDPSGAKSHIARGDKTPAKDAPPPVSKP